MALKNVNTLVFGSGPAAGAFGGPGFGGPPGGFMHPHSMMGGGLDLTYMGRGASYGGFPGSVFQYFSCRRMLQFRTSLSAYKKKAAILNAISQNQVSFSEIA